jgi:cobalt/nickel transport system permease protein
LHIPDGYLSPESCAAAGVVMVPMWATAARRVRASVHDRRAPLLAVGAAYSFVVMMFNVPVPGGTSAHAVGAVLVAIVLGPWAAVIAVSTALGIQALFFGDGGVLSFGANALNLAFVMPMAGYVMYRLVGRGAPALGSRRVIAAGIGAYVGLNTAALFAAIELGLQPVLFHAANGTPLYSPFHLAETVPAMLLAHLTLGGGVEVAMTVGVMRFLQRAHPELLRAWEMPAAARERAFRKPVLIGLGLGVLLTPLGLIASGTAFGEQPRAGAWHRALLEGYDFTHAAHPSIGYVASAIFGLTVIALSALGASWLLSLARRRDARA